MAWTSDILGILPHPYIFCGGWSYPLPSLTSHSQQLIKNPNGKTSVCDYTSGYVFRDRAGVRHSFGLLNTLKQTLTTCETQFSLFEVTSAQEGPYQATLDSSSGGAALVTITGPDGTVMNSSGLFSSPTFGDRNGNLAGDLNDDAGRAVISLGYSSTTPQVPTTVTVSGLSNPYTITSGSASSSFTVGSTLLADTATIPPDPNCPGALPGGSDTQSAFQAITLPNGKAYQFQYEPVYGLLSKVVYPSGGYVSYSWGLNPQSESIEMVFSGPDPSGVQFTAVCRYRYDSFAVKHRYVSFDGTNIALQQDFDYVTNWGDAFGHQWFSKQTTVTTHDLLRPGQPTFQTVYSYSSMQVLPLPPDSHPPFNFAGQIALESKIVYKDTSGAVLKTVYKNWADQYRQVAECVMLDNGLTSGTFYSYGANYSYGAGSQITDKKEFDYGLVASGSCQFPSTTPTRETAIIYQNFTNSGLSIFDRPSSVKTYGNGTLAAETDYAYDQTAVAAVSPAPTSHDETGYGASSTIPRGNATTVTRKCLQSCADAVITYTYDETGQTVSMKDANGNTTNYSYADNFDSNPSSNTNAYVTQVTRPPTNGVSHIQKFKYAYSDGQLIQSTDENSLVTSYLYSDPLRRLTETDNPDGGKSTISYNDVPPSPTITTSKKINSAQTLTAVGVMDGLGHVVQARLCEDGPGCAQPIQTDTAYDGLGRVRTQSNPHRSASASTDGVTAYNYDALGRAVQLIPPDGSATSNNVATAYSGNTTTVIDQAGHQRRSVSDGLGRLIEVDEPGAASPGTPATGSLTINGILNSILVGGTAAKSGSGSFTVTGSEQQNPGTCDPTLPHCSSCSLRSCRVPIFDAGTEFITVNGGQFAASYGQNSTALGTATGLANALIASLQFTASPSSVDSTHALVSVTAKAAGAATNYPLTVPAATFDSTHFSSPSFTATASGATLTGGADASSGTPVFDSGTLSVSVNGFTVSGIPYGQSSNSTASQVAQAVANALKGAGSPVTVNSVSGAAISLTYNSAGTVGDVAVTVTPSSSNASSFPSGSFASSGSLSGGVNPIPPALTNPFVTQYAYDTLDNLTCVVQKGGDTSSFTNCAAAPATWRPRTFTYNSLSRLLTASNPESGAITYAYDADGNVSTKKDARNITTTYGYDALNRPISNSYSNGDPSISITYDQANCLGLAACSNIGHRTSITDAAGFESWSYQVDPGNLRSIHKEQRSTSGITKSATYTFNLAAGLTSVVYPSGRTVNYTYDNAGRPSTAADSANGITYAAGACGSGSGVCYAPQGALASAKIGVSSLFTGLALTNTYNTRLQPLEFKASSTSGNAMDITYNFNLGTGNTGRVYGITNNLDSTRSQTFAYDALNRLTSALSTSTHATSASHCWGEVFGLDAWGNLQSIAATADSAYVGCSQEGGFTKTADGNNHLSGLSYDSSGNTLTDGANTYVWDGESQLKSAAGVNYLYDGDGRRVSKSNGKLYWYGSGGDILAETDACGNTTAEYIFFGGKRIAMIPWSGASCSSTVAGNPIYYVEDLLGTSRVITTNTGVVCYDADFYPYGGERSYTNTCPQNYKFEGKERDTETGNDDFGARYYSNRFGRWLSADWSSVPVPVPYANLTNPQTLNLYAMVSDDPESFADLDGHACESGVCDFFSGLVNALASDNSVAPRKDAGGDTTFAVGQAVGDTLAAVQGVGQFLLGDAGVAASAGVTIGSGGTAAIVSVPAGVGSAVFAADGAVTATKAVANLGAAAADAIKGAVQKSGNKDQSSSGAKQDKPDTRATKPEKNTLEGAQDQADSISKAKEKLNKTGQGNKIQSTKKSEQRLKNQLKKIQSLKDVQD
jgi:RHS repeat-associated protein